MASSVKKKSAKLSYFALHRCVSTRTRGTSQTAGSPQDSSLHMEQTASLVKDPTGVRAQIRTVSISV